MVSNIDLLKINDRLNAIMGVLNTATFGESVHILFVGDLFQLKPCSNDWIFKDVSEKVKEKAKEKKKKTEKNAPYIDLSKNLWREHMKLYELTECMRQRDDKPWAMALNRFREGNHTPEDIEMVEARVIKDTDEHPYHTPHIYYRNVDVAKFNKQVYDRADEESKVTVKANTFVSSDVPKLMKTRIMNKLETEQEYQSHKRTGGLVKELNLCEGLQYDYTINVDTEDGITNGTSCVLKKIQYMEEYKKPSVLWVEFDKKEIGCRQRSENRHLYSRDIPSNYTPMTVRSNTFEVLKKSVTRQQFPCVPSAARTFHACQGKSLQSAAMSMPDRRVDHIHYTGLSRVTKLKNLTILKFNKDKISVSEDVKKEMERLRTKCRLQLSYEPVYCMSNLTSKSKVIFHNVTSLHCHIDDLRCDMNYLSSDIIGVAESRLMSTDNDEDYALRGFQRIIRNDQSQESTDTRRPAHGIAVYVKESVEILQQNHYQTDAIEYSLFTLINKFVPEQTIQIAFVYKAKACDAKLLEEVMLDLKSKTDCSYALSVLGDFNIDVDKFPNIVKKIEKILGCKQLQKDYTYIVNEDIRSTIDLIFTNASSPTAGVIESLFSNHRIITLQC